MGPASVWPRAARALSRCIACGKMHQNSLMPERNSPFFSHLTIMKLELTRYFNCRQSWSSHKLYCSRHNLRHITCAASSRINIKVRENILIIHTSKVVRAIRKLHLSWEFISNRHLKELTILIIEIR